MKSASPGYAARSGSGYDSATAKGSVERKGDLLRSAVKCPTAIQSKD